MAVSYECPKCVWQGDFCDVYRDVDLDVYFTICPNCGTISPDKVFISEGVVNHVDKSGS